jgi:hypothetical protein
MINLSENDLALFIFKIKMDTGLYKTISNLQRINKNSIDKISNILNGDLEIKANEYHTTPVTQIIITYVIIPSEKSKGVKEKISSLLPQNIKNV